MPSSPPSLKGAGATAAGAARPAGRPPPEHRGCPRLPGTPAFIVLPEAGQLATPQMVSWGSTARTRHYCYCPREGLAGGRATRGTELHGAGRGGDDEQRRDGTATLGKQRAEAAPRFSTESSARPCRSVPLSAPCRAPSCSAELLCSLRSPGCETVWSKNTPLKRGSAWQDVATHTRKWGAGCEAGECCWPGVLLSVPGLWAQTVMGLSRASPESYLGHRPWTAFA